MSYGSETLALSPSPVARTHATIREASTSLPQGPSAPVELCCLAHRGLYDPMRQSHRHAAISRHSPYTQRLRCAGAPRRPVGPSLLSLLLFPCVPSTLLRQVPCLFVPLYFRQRFQAPSKSERVATCNLPSLPAIADGSVDFGVASVRFMLRPACLPSPPGWLRQDEVTCSSPRLLRYIVTPAFNVARYRATLGVRLNGRTGNLPLLGLSPNQFTAASEAAADQHG